MTSPNSNPPSSTAEGTAACHSAGIVIDRIAPTIQPEGRLVMYQNWRDLLFLHWPVPAEMLRPLVPPELELDLFDGTAYVGLIPFRMSGVRPIGLPAVPWLSHFCETNVRTYVHYKGQAPGVWFFSLDAANALAVRIARAWFHLPYHYSRMYLEHEMPARRRTGDELEGSLEYPILYAGARRYFEPIPASYVIRAQPVGLPKPAAPRTFEHFLVERYILYTKSRGKLLRGHVQHTPYPLQAAKLLSLSETMLAANGLNLAPAHPFAHFARGVNVKVFNLLPVL
jgi:uncharacterized protein YqjF (DUF2071 family)